MYRSILDFVNGIEWLSKLGPLKIILIGGAFYGIAMLISKFVIKRFNDKVKLEQAEKVGNNIRVNSEMGKQELNELSNIKKDNN